MVITQESTRECSISLEIFVHLSVAVQHSKPPVTSSQGGWQQQATEEIPDEVMQAMAEDDIEVGGLAGAAGGNIKVCPHCTFENTHGGSDCEVCGLPLG